MSLDAASCESLRTDQLDALADEIATFAARIDVAEHAPIARLRVFGTLKKVDSLFGRGELSYSKVRVITRVATPESEQDFIHVASQIERLSRLPARARCVARSNGAAEESSSVRASVGDLQGMVRIEMQLPPRSDCETRSARGQALRRGAGSATFDDAQSTRARGEPAAPDLSPTSSRSRPRPPPRRELPGVPDSAASGHDLEELEPICKRSSCTSTPRPIAASKDGSKVALAEMLD